MVWKRKIHRNQKLPKNYYNYFDVCTMEGIPKERAKNAIGIKKVEGIKDLPELAPIEQFFEAFEKAIEGKMVYSYGIKRSIYNDWKDTGKIPKFSPGRPRKEGMACLKVDIPISLKNELMRAIKKANSISMVEVTQKQVVAVAIREWLDRRPQFLDLDDKK